MAFIKKESRFMTDEEKTELIKLAFESIDKFPVSLSKSVTISDATGNFINLQGEVIIKLVDLSFKLYILNHTETETEKQRLDDYCTIIDYMAPITKDRKTTFNGFLFSIRSVYPYLNDDDILHCYADYFDKIFIYKESVDPSFPVLYSARLINYVLFFNNSVIKFSKTFQATDTNRLENQDYWPLIKPIFKNCAKELIDSQKKETGKTFGTYFYGPGNDKLEGILKSQKLWSDSRMIKNQNRKETSQEVSSREYRRWKKNFDSWFKRYQLKTLSPEKMPLYMFEKVFWNISCPSVLSMQFTTTRSLKDEKEGNRIFFELIDQANNSVNADVLKMGSGTK